MSIKQQIEAGLRGEQSVTNSLIVRYAEQQKIDYKPIMEKFQAAVKAGTHAEMYIGRPADWTFVPRKASYGFGA